MNPETAAAGRAKRFRPTDEYDGQVRCPWCESADTRLVSPYGPSVAEMMLECLSCKQSFGWLKWQRRLPD